MEQFCKDTFGSDDTMPLDRFWNIFDELQRTCLDKYLNNNSIAKSASSTFPPISVSIPGQPQAELTELLIQEEPSCSQRGAFFNNDGTAHRFLLNLATATDCVINLFIDSNDAILTFLIVRNGKSIEGIGHIVETEENICAAWKGDLPAGDYQLIPFPIVCPKTQEDSDKWDKISETDKHGELRLTAARNGHQIILKFKLILIKIIK